MSSSNRRFERSIRRLNTDYARCTKCDGDGWSSRLKAECPWCSQGWVKKKKSRRWLWLLVLAVLLVAFILVVVHVHKAPAAAKALPGLFLYLLYFVHLYRRAPEVQLFYNGVFH